MYSVFHARLHSRFIEIQSNLGRKKLQRTDQGYNFLRGSFSNRDNVKVPIQFRRESKPQHLKRWFFLKNRTIHFHINSTSVITLVKQIIWNFPFLMSLTNIFSYVFPCFVKCRYVIFHRVHAQHWILSRCRIKLLKLIVTSNKLLIAARWILHKHSITAIKIYFK